MKITALRTTTFTAVVMTSALALTGCTGEPDREDDDVISIATQRQPHLYAPYAYEDFAPEGTTIEVVPMDTSTDQMTALLSGDVDFALMGVPTVITGVSEGSDITLVASGADGGSGLIGDAEIEGVADLEGRTVGYVPGSSQEMAFRLLAEEAGLDPDTDINMVNLGYADMHDALSSGDIDAFAGAEVGVSLSLLDGAEPVEDIYTTPLGPVNIGLATTGTLAEENPDLVQELLSIHEQATAHLEENPSEWIEAVQGQFSFENEVLEQAVENIWLRSDIDEEYRSNIDELALQMQELEIISEAPVADDVVTEME